MFFMVGIIYDRVHHRNLDEFGGLYGLMPKYTALAMGLFFAGLGLPGLCGFIGEVLVVLSVWKFSPLLAILSASVVILTAAYILWAIQRVYLGPEYKGPHAEEIRPINNREFSIGAILLSLAILFGVFPNLVIRYMDNTVEAQVESLNEWRVRYEASAETEEEADPSAEPVITAPSADVVLTDVAQPLTSMIRNEAALVVKVHEQQ
jgi:NADH-quinone oxidoreductase subunit M